MWQVPGAPTRSEGQALPTPQWGQDCLLKGRGWEERQGPVPVKWYLQTPKAHALRLSRLWQHKNVLCTLCSYLNPVSPTC